MKDQGSAGMKGQELVGMKDRGLAFAAVVSNCERAEGPRSRWQVLGHRFAYRPLGSRHWRFWSLANRYRLTPFFFVVSIYYLNLNQLI